MSLYTIRYSVWGLPGPFDWLKSTTIHDILKVRVTMATCVFIHPVLLNVERISRIHFEFAFFPSFLADEDNIMTTTTEKAGLALNGPWRNNMNQTKQVGRMLIWFDASLTIHGVWTDLWWCGVSLIPTGNINFESIECCAGPQITVSSLRAGETVDVFHRYRTLVKGRHGQLMQY